MRRRRYANSYKPAGSTFNKPAATRSNTLWLALVAVAAGAILLLSVVVGGGGGSITAEPPGAAVLDAACDAGTNCATPRPTPAALHLPVQSPRATPDAAAPAVSAAGVIVLEEPCGAVLFQSSPTLQLAPASLTKIMTALVTVDRVDMSDIVTVKTDGPALSLENDATVMGIKPGQRLSVRDLLYGLLMVSGNDAAIELADYVAGSEAEFVALMNEKARALGLTNTHFSNPHGLDDTTLYSSAMDMATMGRALLRNEELARIVRTVDYQPRWDGPAIHNINLLLTGFQGAIGVKTGYTDVAHQTIVGAAEDGGRRIIVSMLRADDMYAEAPALLNWAFADTQPACAPAAAG